MACDNCEQKGYIETFIAKSAKMRPMLSQCPKCRDTKAYSKRVKELMRHDVEEPARVTKNVNGQILAFPSISKKEE